VFYVSFAAAALGRRGCSWIDVAARGALVALKEAVHDPGIGCLPPLLIHIAPANDSQLGHRAGLLRRRPLHTMAPALDLSTMLAVGAIAMNLLLHERHVHVRTGINVVFGLRLQLCVVTIVPAVYFLHCHLHNLLCARLHPDEPSVSL